MDRWSILLLKILPQHFLSSLIGKLTKIERVWLKKFIISQFIKKYKVNLTQAIEKDALNYKNFNSFFTRAIDLKYRPISDKKIISPVDGKISFMGNLNENSNISVKNSSFVLSNLLANDHEKIKEFKNSEFVTIYLSPKDYHRIHIPFDGQLKKMVFVPGSLFSVNELSVRSVPNIFSKNERLIFYFETEGGLMALIMVGAIFVGSMQTVWHGDIKEKELKTWDYQDTKDFYFAKGDEIARFNMGSTVIILNSNEKNSFLSGLLGKPVLMGERIV